jgi:hypothetical protein
MELKEALAKATDVLVHNTQAVPPDPSAGNGHEPRPGSDTAVQELSPKNVEQTLEAITGRFGPITPPQFMTLSGNACKLYVYCSSADWVGIPLQEDLLPFGTGMQDIRTVLRVIHELWQHRCIQVRFNETAVDTPVELRIQGKKVVLDGLMGYTRRSSAYIGHSS